MENVGLKIVGKASNNVLIKFNAIFGQPVSQSEIVLFCDYSGFNIPIGHTFTNIEDRHNNAKFSGTITLKKISQQYARLFEEIPAGWKTICLFSISGEVSSLLQDLPSVNSWYDSKRYLIFT